MTADNIFPVTQTYKGMTVIGMIDFHRTRSPKRKRNWYVSTEMRHSVLKDEFPDKL